MENKKKTKTLEYKVPPHFANGRNNKKYIIMFFFILIDDNKLSTVTEICIVEMRSSSANAMKTVSVFFLTSLF